jgi:hypothetical protein
MEPGAPSPQLLPYATEVVLRPRISSKDVVAAIIAGVFLLCACLVVPAPLYIRWMGFFCASISVLLVGFEALKFMPGSTFLRLESGGLTHSWLFSRRAHRWDNIRELRAMELGSGGRGTSHVVAIYCVHRPEYQHLTRQQRRQLQRRHPGRSEWDDLIDPSDYGKSAEELLSVLETWRKKRS